MRITALISGVKTSAGSFTPEGSNESRSYDNDIVTALIDGLDPVEIKVKGTDRDQIAGLDRGQTVTLDVDVPKGTRLSFVRVVPAKG